ncbi:NAD(P)H-dependent oxidoreductase [Candidatus Roizmanbacteria bacterium]|nr:NAD(P)H-dependent oxidoreductase [Candidatus Roizmanbacteria bacterium]
MRITVINGTNRIGNKTILVSKAVEKTIRDLGIEVSLVTLDNFDTLFRGKYITLDSANPTQKSDIGNMIKSDILLFVVPTYHSGIPSPLKNLLDILKGKEIYNNKVIGAIAVSDHNQDLGARQTVQILNGILSYLKLTSFVVPRINVVDLENLDKDRLFNYIKYCASFLKLYEQANQSYLGYDGGNGFLRLS